MNFALSAAIRQISLVYFDDVVDFSRSAAKQIDHFKHVLTLSFHAEVSQKIQKSRLFAEANHYLNNGIRLARLEIASHTKNAIKKLNVQRTVTEMKLFLALWSPPNTHMGFCVNSVTT